MPKDQPVGAPIFATPNPSDIEPISRTRQSIHAHFDAVKQWTAESPYLYKIQFTLLKNGRPQHTVTSRFGFRTIELRKNDGFYLNGTKIIMKGVNRHSLWADSGRTLSKALCYEDARLIKDMNMNAVRMSHYPPNREFLDACDEMGLYVLDEFTGWGGHYETPIGKKLVGEMVRRDVNHPSVLVWDNGNEGAWNNALDVEFDKWDAQNRIVMHPESRDHGVNDPHYPDYSAIVKGSSGPAVYFPTEFQHGLYDGGLGSDFRDYWDVLSKSKVLGGAFFWVFCDDGIVRTDKGGIIDNSGNLGPDGIMGPRREKEGSYYTIKQIWSPVQIEAPPQGLQPGFQGTIKIENSYDFTNLAQCKLSWEYVTFPGSGSSHAGHTVVANGETTIPSLPPHTSGDLNVSLPAREGVDAVYFTATNAEGANLWTWSWPVRAGNRPMPATAGAKVTSEEGNGELIVKAGSIELHFNSSSGQLSKVVRASKELSLSNGPRFLAYVRDKKGRRPTTYTDVATAGNLTSFKSHADGPDLIVTADYSGSLKRAVWHISANGQVKLNYTYSYDGPADMLGISFDYPESEMKAIDWLGFGPYRSWQNRLEGTRLDVWHNDYNNTVPSVVYSFAPEFKGYFRNWQWATFDTAQGKFTASTTASESYLGVYTPNDGPDQPLLALPKSDIAFFDVIPAMRNKFLSQDRLGPQSASKQISGEHSGEVAFDFGLKK